ncbi:UDP-N-acetylenolpyruvoylglucosamine reductase [Candidatus Gracilibacteria bacterium]|nr:MAG: UDP-N-acetylenolpyruvoylglucosamine reductase [Candidatus Gracilibacteria bacterium]
MKGIPLFLQENTQVGHYSGYKTKVQARYFYEIKNEHEVALLSEIYTFSKTTHLPIIFISSGTNILFSTSKIDAIIVKNSLQDWEYDTKNKILHAKSNAIISDIAQELEDNFEQNIWHRFIGLPGSIGGAVVGNAGCFGLEVGPFVKSVKVFDIKNSKILNLTQNDLGFGYRSSYLKENRDLFLVSAEFDLSTLKEKYASDADVIDFRENKQPKGNSCGSFFKNPSRENTAGKLIEQVGLKGFRNGGAYWSDLHANFLLSDGENCRPEDLIELVKMTQKIVKLKTGFQLEPEIRIL